MKCNGPFASERGGLAVPYSTPSPGWAARSTRQGSLSAWGQSPRAGEQAVGVGEHRGALAEGKRTGAGEGILVLSSCLLSRQLPREQGSRGLRQGSGHAFCKDGVMSPGGVAAMARLAHGSFRGHQGKPPSCRSTNKTHGVTSPSSINLRSKRPIVLCDLTRTDHVKANLLSRLLSSGRKFCGSETSACLG